MSRCPSLSHGIALACLLGLAACASAPPAAHVASRDFRSQAYCVMRAESAGYADYDVAAACRRSEKAAATRAQITRIDTNLDKACEAEASFGQVGGPFSWRAYMRCVDDSI
jgi:hypothetical protein